MERRDLIKAGILVAGGAAIGAGINIKNNVKLSEIIPHLPKIEHFIQNGNKCANICGLDCNYCTKGVKEIEKILGL